MQQTILYIVACICAFHCVVCNFSMDYTIHMQLVYVLLLYGSDTECILYKYTVRNGWLHYIDIILAVEY